MKICWDNLGSLRYSKTTGKWYAGSQTFVFCESCKICKESFLGRVGAEFCTVKCRQTGKGNSFYNKKHSESNKNRWSESKKEELNTFYGKKHTKESRKKISRGNRGKVLSEKHKQLLSVLLSGENNPNWKGGISAEPYCFVWGNKEFKEFIRSRDNYKCQNPQCTKPSKRLAIHHIDYKKKNCNLNNLIVLCYVCNSMANYNREWWKCYYKEIMIRKGVGAHG